MIGCDGTVLRKPPKDDPRIGTTSDCEWALNRLIPDLPVDHLHWMHGLSNQLVF